MSQKIVKIFGPPGTGKTTELRRLVEYEVNKNKVPLSSIGYLSFTKGAAEVIRERMKAEDADVRWFRTIHSACMSLLGIGRDSVIGPADYREFGEWSGMIVKNYEFDDWDTSQPLDFTPVKRALEMAAATGRPIIEIAREMPSHVNLTPTCIAHFDAKWREYKIKHRKFDFTDMLTEYRRRGEPMPVQVLILDEAQDLSQLQWDCFHILMRTAKRVYMAGDDDQCIYGFIGGAEYGFLEHPCTEERTISKSFRVPRAVGREAERIIKQVARRKKKKVKWRDVDGSVKRLNLDAYSIPWNSLIKKYKSIMVLTRHRKGARDFSDDLKTIGIPHALTGEGASNWREANIIHTFYRLKDGKTVTIKAANALLEELKLTPIQGRPRQQVGSPALQGMDWETATIASRLGGNFAKRVRRYDALRRLINQEGYEILAKDPVLRVSTMHAAKGDEAELVIIVPECANIVRQNMLTPSEIRLSYVAMTRAIKDVIVLVPTTDNYIVHFFGG
jgi:DNA helicase II / ATP-dependent DNA helicase PcrA